MYTSKLNKNGEEYLKQLGEMLDEHLDMAEGDEGSSDGGDLAKTVTAMLLAEVSLRIAKEEEKQIKDEIKENMISAAQSAGAGNVPGAVARMIKELTEPKMNWREIIRQSVQSTIRSDYTFSRPSRKGQMSGAILPSMDFQDTIDIACCIDMIRLNW